MALVEQNNMNGFQFPVGRAFTLTQSKHGVLLELVGLRGGRVAVPLVFGLLVVAFFSVLSNFK